MKISVTKPAVPFGAFPVFAKPIEPALPSKPVPFGGSFVGAIPQPR